MSTPKETLPRNVGLSRGQIFQGALQLLDEAGLEALSMRTLASRLHVKAASLYNHVSSKAALLDGIQALVFSQIKPPSAKLPWKEYLRKLASAWRKALRQHPHTILLFASRPSVFGEAFRQAETSLRLLTQAGFSPAQGLYLYQSLAVFVLGHALAELDPKGLEKDPNPKDPLSFSTEKFPALSTIPQHIFQNTSAWFQLGITALLEGAEALLHHPTNGVHRG